VTQVTKDHNGRNRAARERLEAVIARVGARDVVVDDDWTAAGLLAHLAFWDRLAVARLERHLREGEPPVFATDAVTDLTNAAGMRQWKDTPPRVAGTQAREAAAEIDQLIEKLPSDKLDGLKALGRSFLIDRSNHRKEHLDQIERALP
jgi:DinB superfamily